MKDIRSSIVLSDVWQLDLAGLGIVVILSFAAYLVGVAPLVRRASTVESQKQQLAQETRKTTALTASRRELTRQLDEARKAVETGSFRLRSVKQLNWYLAQLTKLATASEMTLHEIQPGKPTRGPHYWSVPIIMSGTGRYRTCARFLHGLHKALPDTRLSSLQLNASSGNSRTPTANFRFSLIWHAAPDQKSVTE